MQTITIDEYFIKLNETETLNENDKFLIKQNTAKRTGLGEIKKYIQKDVINSLVQETNARIQGDNNTLQAAKEYTDQEIINGKLAVNEWLAPVRTAAQIPKTGLDKTRNYLIKVVADPIQSGVYQAVAGWTTVPNWVLYSDDVDFVDEQEMSAAVGAHNTNAASHADIRQAVKKIDDDYITSAALKTNVNEHNTDTAAHEDIRADIQKINEDYVNESDIENAVNTHNQNTNSHIDIRNIIANHTGIPSWDSNNFILTFTAENGTTLEVDIPLEALSRDLDYDPLTKELVITKQNGSEIRVSVADLIDVYEGSTGEHIQITVEDNLIRAALLSGSINENELSNTLLEKINSKIGVDMIGAPNGAASLDAQAKVPLDQLPDVIAGDISSLVNQVEQNRTQINSLFTSKQDKLNRTLTGDDNASGTVTDTGGNLSIPIPVTVAAGTSTAALPLTSKMSLRQWLVAIRNNVAYLINKAFLSVATIDIAGNNNPARGLYWADTPTGEHPFYHHPIDTWASILRMVSHNTNYEQQLWFDFFTSNVYYRQRIGSSNTFTNFKKIVMEDVKFPFPEIGSTMDVVLVHNVNSEPAVNDTGVLYKYSNTIFLSFQYALKITGRSTGDYTKYTVVAGTWKIIAIIFNAKSATNCVDHWKATVERIS